MEYRGELCNQHKLAGLWRRGDDELSLADAWLDGAELRLCGNGYGCFNCIDSRHCATYSQRYWKLLGGSYPHYSLYSSATFARGCSRTRLSRRSTNFQSV